MYDMTRVNQKGYFDANDNEGDRYLMKLALNEQRTKDYISGEYERAGGVVSEVTPDMPKFVCDYHDYYKGRAYHARSLNSNDGWNKTSSLSFINFSILTYAEEIRSAVLLVHGENAHSRYFSEDVFKRLKGDNKELYIVKDASHTDLYDGGVNHDKIPFDKIEAFIKENI